MKYITGDEWLRVKGYWLMVIGLMLIAGCSSDSSGEQQRSAGSPLQVVPYIAAYQGNDALSRRAVSEGYSPYTPNQDISIGLFILPASTDAQLVYKAQLVRYSNGDWHSQIMVEGNHNYTIYGYMPMSITSSISQSGGNTTLTLTDIPAVSADDICFVTGVKDGKIGDAGDLLQGKFDYAGKTTNNYLCLLFDHLFAAVNFHFTIDPEYAALRSIKLKKMELTTTKSAVNATITLTPNTTGADPVTSISYSTTDGTSTATFFENAAGIELKEDNAATIGNYFACFAPDLDNELTLVCTYDVYDRYGNKIAERTTPNKLRNLNTVRGQLVTLNLNIAPTYLGVLSEPDLDNPTIKIQ